MEFKDFAKDPQKLVGKKVLYELGMSFSKKRRCIVRIEKVTKTGFRLASIPEKLFSLVDGSQKGLGNRMDASLVSQCKILSDEEANKLIQEWRQKKEEKALREKMKAKLESMTFEQLKKMDLL